MKTSQRCQQRSLGDNAWIGCAFFVSWLTCEPIVLEGVKVVQLQVTRPRHDVLNRCLLRVPLWVFALHLQNIKVMGCVSFNHF
jgi:hypothetical protein